MANKISLTKAEFDGILLAEKVSGGRVTVSEMIQLKFDAVGQTTPNREGFTDKQNYWLDYGLGLSERGRDRAKREKSARVQTGPLLAVCPCSPEDFKSFDLAAEIVPYIEEHPGHETIVKFKSDELLKALDKVLESAAA